jgi:hypothetical protein
VDRPVAAFAVTPVCIYRRRRYFTISLGHRPRNLIARKQALKARFTFGQVQKLDESRFQRLAFGPSMNLRCCPRLEIESKRHCHLIRTGLGACVAHLIREGAVDTVTDPIGVETVIRGGDDLHAITVNIDIA